MTCHVTKSSFLNPATANRKEGRRYADRRANGLKEDAKGRADFAIIREGVERSAPTLIELVS